MWDIKQKATNERDIQTNKNSSTHNSLAVTGGKGRRWAVEKGQGSQIYGDRGDVTLGGEQCIKIRTIYYRIVHLKPT